MNIRLGVATDFKKVTELFKILDDKHIKNRSDFKKKIDSKRYSDILEKCLKNINHILLIAEIDDDIIGFGIGRIIELKNHPFLENHKIGEILYLIVQDNYKKSGIGGDIFNDLESRLKLNGVDRLELRVYEFNKEAVPESFNYQKKFTIYEKLISN